MINNALRYLEEGWNVIPVDQNKRPKISWKEYQQRKVTKADIEDWWSRWPGAGIAVLTGEISGLVVIDVDEKQGLEQLESFLQGRKTLTCLTGGGGKHFYFKHPGITQVPNAVRFLSGVDCRGDGGYVVVPPSVHHSGRRYRWEDPTAKPIDLPLELLSAIVRKAKKQKLPEDIWEMEIPKGTRDHELTRRAGKLLQIGMSPAEVLAMLQTINERHCKPPLPDWQVHKIVNSIAARESAKQASQQSAPTSRQNNTTTQPFKLTRYWEFMAANANSETRWLVDGWLSIGSIGKIVGPPESYKTWILLDLAVSVASGRPFLGKYEVKKRGPVILFQQEDGAQILGKRLNLVAGNKVPVPEPSYGVDDKNNEWLQMPQDLPIYVRTEGVLAFDMPESVDLLQQILEEVRPVLVILDPLYSAASTKDYMMDVARTMLVIKDFREQYKTSFVLGHHSRKGGKEGDREEGWGSQFLNAFDEFQWHVRVKTDGSVMVKRKGKISGPQPELSLTFDIETENEKWHYAVTAAASQMSDEEQQRIILHSRIRQMKNQGFTYRQIAEELGISQKTIRKALAESDDKE